MEIMGGEHKELNWFSRWEEELPSPEELMPLSQTLITADLALAFDIPANRTAGHDTVPSAQPSTPKKPRLVWSPQLHKRFVEAVAHLGIKNAVPKTIMQLMNVDGLTRENVASHLQKYRLYLKRMQRSSTSSAAFAVDAATDRLFATAPVPSQLLRPFAPAATMQHYRQMTAAAEHHNPYYNHNRMGTAAAEHHNPYYNHNRMGVMQRMTVLRPLLPPPSYVEERGAGERKGRRVLTLFPDD